MEKRKDYYKILGITDDERKLTGSEFEEVIKKKYRKIAIDNHPDRLQGKSDEERKRSEEFFKDASEAYEVLKDEKKRAEYDNPASDFKFEGVNFGGMDIRDIFRHFHGFGMDFDFGGGGQPQQVKGQGIRIKLGVTLEEIYNGSTRKVKYRKYKACPVCNGSGMTKNSKMKTCRTCGGSGQIIGGSGFFTSFSTCPTCGGQGKVIDNPCYECDGHGITLQEVETDIVIPKGIKDGMQLVNYGGGHTPPHANGVDGDLYVYIEELAHDVYDREGDDLYMELEIPVAKAILGSQETVNTIGGKKLNIKVPRLVEDGHQLRLRGYGMPVFGNDGKFGDLIVIVRLKMPKQINAEEEEIFKKLSTHPNFS